MINSKIINNKPVPPPLTFPVLARSKISPTEFILFTSMNQGTKIVSINKSLMGQFSNEWIDVSNSKHWEILEDATIEIHIK